MALFHWKRRGAYSRRFSELCSADRARRGCSGLSVGSQCPVAAPTRSLYVVVVLCSDRSRFTRNPHMIPDECRLLGS
jgi:hypothetical protein